MFLFFFMEETNYPGRVPAAVDVSLPSTPPEGPLKEKDANNATVAMPGDGISRIGQILETRSSKSYIGKLSLYHRRSFEQPNRLLQKAWQPLHLLSFPIIFWCGFMYGAGLIFFNVLNDSTALILGGAPYNFKPSLVGLAYISPIIFAFLAHVYTGPLGDRFALWLARRRNGVLEAEFRLWLFTPSLLLVPFGLILWGVGAAHGIHWFGEVFAMGVIAATALVALQLPIAYCVDCYYDLASEAIVSVILVRNTMSFAIGYGITPWIQNLGYQNAFISCAFAGLAVTLSYLPIALFGKRMRLACWPRFNKAVELQLHL